MKMKQIYFNSKTYFLFFFLFTTVVFSQGDNSIWATISENEITQEKLFRKSQPSEAIFYVINMEAFKEQFQNVPKRGQSTEISNVIVDFPDSDGIFQQYRIKEASVLELELQNQHPNIRSYVGTNIDNPKTIIRFSVSQDGLHAMFFRTENGTQLIDPYTKDRENYIVYSKKDLPSIDHDFICEFENNLDASQNIDLTSTSWSQLNDGNLRTYRLALACTGEYAEFHLTQQGVGAGETEAVKKAAVLTALNTTMTRVNGVYENELSVTMTIVASNDNVIFVDPATDPFTGNNNPFTLINESQTVIDSDFAIDGYGIGDANYDIGHTFSTGAGGLAWLGVPCSSGSKARGVTGRSSPIGDAFDVDYVAHEMGHQFGANHTFNNSCGGNRNDATAVEPGSGSTIMAYAGICSPNVQNNSDDYFHSTSLREMWTYITSSGICAAESSTGNSSPTINALTSFSIPKSTPFVLRGNGDDSDGAGTLTYGWEQSENAIATMPPDPTSTTGPAFRSLTPSSSPDRFMPAIETVIAGNIASTWEVVPSVARDLNFDLTVRDNDASGGRFATESMVVSVEDVAPFIITAPNAAVVWGQGTTKTITWDVGSTTNGTINCQNVNIKLSTDGGLTYPISILANTLNDGTEDITVPNNMSTTCRIMVEAADNIFYDISNLDFTIAAADGPTDYCPSIYSTDPSEFISNVIFGTINNDSGNAATNGYEDFTSISADVDVDTSYQIDVEINTAGNFTDYCEVYIDWNQDNVFDIATEYYDLGSITDVTAGVLSFNIVVPSDAGVGSTRMRVTIQDDPNPGPCTSSHTSNYGETEDYSLNVLSGLSVDENAFNNFKFFPNPSGGVVTISLQSETNEDIEIALYDVLGRKISNKKFESNNLLFNEQLHYDNLSKGIYLLKVTQGDKSTSRQLIIN